MKSNRHETTERPRRSASTRRRTNPRLRGDAGAGMVEMGLLAPILFMIAFAVIDYGIVLNDQIALRQGVREAARRASVADWGYFPDPSDPSCTDPNNCPINDGTRLYWLIKEKVGLEPWADTKIAIASGNAGYAFNEPIAICAQRKIDSTTGFFDAVLGDRWIKSKVEIVVDQTTLDPDFQPGQNGIISEPVDNTTDWNWCTVDT